MVTSIDENRLTSAAPSRASFGRSLLVALGCHATVLAAISVGSASIPRAPERDCPGFFSCMSPSEDLMLIAAVFGVPILSILLTVTLTTLALVVGRTRSSILAGVLAATAGALAVGLAGAAFLAYMAYTAK